MTSPHDFDAFYVESRQQLLVQTWAVSGDLRVARRAVRDAYVVAWHRWSKVGRTEHPESVVRPQAWASAQRRSSTRPWHRERGVDEEVRATLDALGKLTATQRRVLVLSHLASLSFPEISRELGLVGASVERELQTATAQLSLHRGVPSTSVRGLFEAMADVTGDTTWPRVTILRRAGATRRRLHVAAGAALTTGALVASGVVVTDTDGLRTSLETERLAGRPAAGTAQQASRPETGLTPRRLITRGQAARLDPERRWRVRDTTDNTAGDGLVLPCQAERYADPDGEEALVRRLRSGDPDGGDTQGDSEGDSGEGTGEPPRLDLTQLVEMSGDVEAARSAYRQTNRWFAGCTEDRMQLLATESVSDVGEQATMFVLRDWDDPVTTYTVGVARTGRTVSTLVRSERTEERPVREPLTALLASTVNALCGVTGTGRCAGPPSAETTDPLPVDPAPGMLSTLDLPPVGDISQPWVGTDPAAATVNVAATRCDETEFDGEAITDDLTRTFLVPEAELPDEFGLTETVGVFAGDPGATDFVGGVRDRMGACEEDFGTEVTPVLDESDDAGERVIWRVTTEVSEDRTVEFLMGMVRNGRAVAQVGFVPAEGSTIEPDAFADLVARAQVRLAAMPGV